MGAVVGVRISLARKLSMGFDSPGLHHQLEIGFNEKD